MVCGRRAKQRRAKILACLLLDWGRPSGVSEVEYCKGRSRPDGSTRITSSRLSQPVIRNTNILTARHNFKLNTDVRWRRANCPLPSENSPTGSVHLIATWI